MLNKEFIVSKITLAKILANFGGLIATRQEGKVNYIKVMVYPNYCQAKLNELGLNSFTYKK